MSDTTERKLRSITIREHTLSFGRLEAFVTQEYGPDLEILLGDGDPFRDGRQQTDGRMASIIGVNRATILRWRKHYDGVPLHQVERIEQGLGVHQWEIWGDDCYPDLPTLDLEEGP